MPPWWMWCPCRPGHLCKLPGQCDTDELRDLKEEYFNFHASLKNCYATLTVPKETMIFAFLETIMCDRLPVWFEKSFMAAVTSSISWGAGAWHFYVAYASVLVAPLLFLSQGCWLRLQHVGFVLTAVEPECRAVAGEFGFCISCPYHFFKFPGGALVSAGLKCAVRERNAAHDQTLTELQMLGELICCHWVYLLGMFTKWYFDCWYSVGHVFQMFLYTLW